MCYGGFKSSENIWDDALSVSSDMSLAVGMNVRTQLFYVVWKQL